MASTPDVPRCKIPRSARYRESAPASMYGANCSIIWLPAATWANKPLAMGPTASSTPSASSTSAATLDWRSGVVDILMTGGADGSSSETNARADALMPGSDVGPNGGDAGLLDGVAAALEIGGAD